MSALNSEYFFTRINNLRISEKEKNTRSKNLNPKNYQKILSYKNIHKGKRCFIIGSSPSLKLLDLKKLNQEYTFCVNRGYKLLEQGLKKVDYYVLADRKLVEDDNLMNEFPQDFCKNFFVNAIIDFPDSQFDTTYFGISLMKDKIFTEDLTQDLTEGYTVIHHAIQIAYYLGFEKIYLIGVDLDFSNISGHAYEEFDSEKKRQLTNSIKEAPIMRKYINCASKHLQSKNRFLFNASPVGTLEIPRVKYEELF